MHATAKRCGTREEADAEIANYAKTRHHRAGGHLQLRPENPKRETAREERDGEIAIRGDSRCEFLATWRTPRGSFDRSIDQILITTSRHVNSLAVSRDLRLSPPPSLSPAVRLNQARSRYRVVTFARFVCRICSVRVQRRNLARAPRSRN